MYTIVQVKGKWNNCVFILLYVDIPCRMLYKYFEDHDNSKPAEKQGRKAIGSKANNGHDSRLPNEFIMYVI